MATPIGNNTEGLQEILQTVNSLPSAAAGGTTNIPDLTPTSGAGTWDNTYADASNQYNSCTYVKSGNVVSVQLQVTINPTVTQTWQELKVASGLPKAAVSTYAMAFFQGYAEFLQIVVNTNGELHILPMNEPGGKTVRGQIVYIGSVE